MVALVVDNRERERNLRPNGIACRLEVKVDTVEEEAGIRLGTVRTSLAVGDYTVVETADEGGVEDGALLARQETQLLAPVIERKTINDLISRSFKQDHLKQLRRLQSCGRSAILLVEGLNKLNLAANAIAYDPTAARPIQSEADIADFSVCMLLRGGTVRLLETNDLEDTERMLVILLRISAWLHSRGELLAPHQSPIAFSQWQRQCMQQARTRARQPESVDDFGYEEDMQDRAADVEELDLPPMDSCEQQLSTPHAVRR